MTDPLHPDTDPAGTDPPAEPAAAGKEPAEPAAGDPPADADTFPREYVERLRRESAGYRERAGQADALAERLMAATVREATAGILADPTDLDVGNSAHLVGEDGFPDPDAIAEAARALVARKPHLGDRRPRGDVGQGARPAAADVDLAGMLRGRAG